MAKHDAIDELLDREVSPVIATGIRKCMICKHADLFDLVERVMARLRERGERRGYRNLHNTLRRGSEAFRDRGPSYYMSLQTHVEKHPREVWERVRSQGA